MSTMETIPAASAAPDTVERPEATLPLPSALAYTVAAVALAAGLFQPFSVFAGGKSLADALADYDLNNVAVAAVLGALILWRRPGHVIGWVLVASGGLDALVHLSSEYQAFGIGERFGLPTGVAVENLFNWLWVPSSALLFMALPQLFPDGRLLSHRWRPPAWFAVAAVLLLATLFAVYPGVDGPEWLFAVAFAGFALAGLVGLVPLTVRFRRSRGAQRQQLKWVFYGIALSVPVSAVDALSGVDNRTTAVLTLIPLVVVPAAITVAVLRFRLYDIDLVINKTVVFVALAAFITAVYAGIVVGLGRLLPIGEGNLGLSIAATAVVAVVFEPVRVRVQHWANRLVYGRRATPYEALAAMTARIGEAADPDSTLAEAARLLAEGTGAAQAVVWVAQDGRLDPRGTAGVTPADHAPVPLLGDDLPGLPGTDLVQPVRHEGQLVGALSLTKRPGEGVSSADRKLVEELAGQATLLLANARLRSRLRDRLEELRASRQRMLAAQDRARHGLERDLHDGAQQELVALKIKLGLARTIATREGAPELAADLAASAAVADQAVDTLREVARGIYPPLLESEGLPAALSAQARRVDLAVTVLDRGTARSPREVEATGYFCAMEAVHNAARHARAQRAHIELDATAEALTVTVTDDGVGFDPDRTAHGAGLTHMADRADAAGGTLTVASRPGHGTTITLVLPITTSCGPRHEPAAASHQASSSISGSNADFVTKSNAPAASALAR